MQRSSIARIAFIACLLSAFLVGLVQLFLLRFGVGDVYPAYSSLRSDPLGTRAFYESLVNLNGLAINRNTLPLRSVEFGEENTLFYLGAPVFDPESVPSYFLEVLDRLTAQGGRLVLAFSPTDRGPTARKHQKCLKVVKEKEESERSESRKGTQRPEESKEDEPVEKDSRESGCRLNQEGKTVSLKAHWGVSFAFEKKPLKEKKHFGGFARSTLDGLPSSISWHTALYFDDLESAWQVIYERHGRPVIVERPFGEGTIVLSADSFFFSNEALRCERHPKLFAWMVGPNSTVVFDEAHLGILKRRGVASLVRQHRFHWFFIGIVVLAILFVWKNSVSFVPPPHRETTEYGRENISDRDSSQGLISLLRRNIPRPKILWTCVQTWEATFERERRIESDKIEQIKRIVLAGQSRQIDPVAGYQRISKILSEGTRHE